VWPPFEHTDSGKGIYQHGRLVGLAFAADYQYGWAVSSAEIPTIRINPIERRAP
jgi:hypothetical protein